jgi:hypothetical protein
MEKIKAWISEHPYLASALGITLIVGLYLILHSGSSSSSSAQTVSANPGGLSDAAYTAQLAANSQDAQTAAALSAQQGQTAAALQANVNAASVQNNQTAAALQLGLQQTITGGEVADYSAASQLSTAQSNDNAGVAEAQLNTGAAVQVAGIQAQVSNATTAAQLQLGLNTNQTSVNLAGIQLQGLQSNNQTSMENTLVNDQAAGAISANTNATQLAENVNNNTTQQVQIGTAGAVAQNQINQTAAGNSLAFTLAQQQLNDTQQDFTGISESGGNISADQGSVLTALAGQPSVGVAIQGSAASQAQSQNSLISSILSGVFGTAGKVATAPLNTVAGAALS